MRKLHWLSFLLLGIGCFIFPNHTEAQKKIRQLSTGEWSIEYYSNEIAKITVQPAGYTRNELVTQAVSLSPKPYSFVKAEIEERGIIVGPRKEVLMRTFFQDSAYSGFRFVLQPGEQVYGGGERALPLNRRGYRFNLHNNPWYGYSEGADNLNFSVPFFISSRGYGLFFDNASSGYADIGKTHSDFFEVGFSSGQLNFYVVLGETPEAILANFHQLTGTQPLPPRWAMGNFMSRFGYTSEAQVKSILGEMKASRMPVDAVIFDLFWFGDSIKHTLGNLDWVNKKAWPNPAGMVRGLAKENIQTVLIAEPFFLKDTRTFNSVQPYLATDNNGKPFMLTDFYFGYGGLLDIFRKDAGDWIWNNHYKRQRALGVKGWWTDLGEPEKHPDGIYHNLKDLGYKRPLAAKEVHNAYGHYWNKMMYDKYRTHLPNERIFHLNRSGFAGSQRYSIFPWSGDVSRSWSGFRAQLPVMLGMSMSGIPYIHADAGGFAGGEGDGELFVRWLQFAAFTPVFRPHGTALYAIEKQAFSFPSEAALIPAPFKSQARLPILWRYAFLPYNYTLAWKQSQQGTPLVAPLHFYHPTDSTAVATGDQFYWGKDVLVAPVLEKGATERRLYLPAGSWYPLFGGPAMAGGGFHTERTIAHQLPVYVRGGAALPFWNNSRAQNTSGFSGKQLTWVYYPSAGKGKSVWYHDDGQSVNTTGEEISLETEYLSNGALHVRISSTQGDSYTAADAKMIQVAIPVEGARRVRIIQGPARVVGRGAVTGIGAALHTISVPFRGKPISLTLQLQ
jgi:oligosaccharide 4-alpha-D-glucosyltransferase